MTLHHWIWPLAMLCAWPGSANADGERLGWQELRARFEKQVRSQALAGRTLLQIGRSGDPAAIPFLREQLERKPESLSRIQHMFPDEGLKSRRSIAGMAQVALAQLGDEAAWEELMRQSAHEDGRVRTDALEKIRLIEGARPVEALSRFIGDLGEGDFGAAVEQGAVVALSKRLENPPAPVHFGEFYAKYYSGDGREKWLRWRYENYGPIPGREELFAGFENAPEAKTDPVPARVTGAPKTDRAPTREPQPAGQPTAEPSHEADATAAPAVAAPPPHRWWPWLGGLVLLGVAALWLRRFGARG